MKKILLATSLSFALLPLIGLAQQIGDAPPITRLGGLTTTLTNIVNWMITAFWIVAVGFLIWAAFLYLTAAGDEDKLKTAKSYLIYALIGAAVALLSTGIQAIVKNILIGTV